MKRTIFIVMAVLAIFAIVSCDNGSKTTTTYTVTFDSNGGSEVAAITGVKSGDKISAPADPSKEGYQFLAWFKDDGTEWNFAADKVTGSITLTAQWIPEGVNAGDVVVLGAYTTVTGAAQKGWASAGMTGADIQGTPTLAWESITGAKYLVIETKGSDNRGGFGGLDVVIQSDGNSWNWDGSKTSVTGDWFAFPSAATDTVTIAIDLSKINTWSTFAAGTQGKITICYYGSGGTLNDLTALGIEAAFLYLVDYPKPAGAVDLPNGKGFVFSDAEGSGPVEPVVDLTGSEKTELKNGLVALYYFELPEGGRWDNYTKITVDYLVDENTLTQSNGVRGGPRLYGNYNATTWAGFKAGTLADGRKLVYADFNDTTNAGNGEMILDNGALGSNWGTVAGAADALGVTAEANKWFTFSYDISGTKKHGSYKESQNKPAANAGGPFVFAVGLSGDGTTTSYLKNVTLVGYEGTDNVIGKALYFTKDGVEMPAFAGYADFGGGNGVNETKRAVNDETTPKKVITWTGAVADYKPPEPPPPVGTAPKYWAANTTLGDLVIDNEGAGWTNLDGEAFASGSWKFAGVDVDLSTALTAVGKNMTNFSHITAVVKYYNAAKEEIATVNGQAQGKWSTDLTAGTYVKDLYNLGMPTEWINAALPSEAKAANIVGFAVQKAGATGASEISYVKVEKIILYLAATETLNIDNDGAGWTNLDGEAFASGSWKFADVDVDLSTALTAAGKDMTNFSYITAEVTYYNAAKEEIATVNGQAQGKWSTDLTAGTYVKDLYNLGMPTEWIRAALPSEAKAANIVGFAVQKAGATGASEISYIKITRVILYKFGN